jgi:phosphoenolpyruvate carboxylase
MKQNVPGFYGLGTALNAFEKRGELDQVKKLYNDSLFFRTLMENCMMSLSKCYFPLTQYLSDHPEFGRIWNKIHDEYILTKRLVLEISGQSELMELAPNARDSVKLREHLVLPILVIQQYALQKIRELEEAADEERALTYHTMVMRTMFAIINAGRNSA